MENSSSPQKHRIVVGIAGGIRSLAAIFLLKKQGHEVLALGIDFWDVEGNSPLVAPPEYLTDLVQLKNICDKWSVPFYAVEAKEQFREEVLNSFVVSKLLGEKISEEYMIHRFLLKTICSKMKPLKATHFASGHLARINQGHLTKFFHIYKSLDHEHDQSHLLAGLNQEELSVLQLPLADLRLSEIETIAEKFAFPKLETKKSENKVVFCESAEMIKYVEKVTPKSLLKAGPLVDTVNDIYYNDHEGIHHFYPGQTNLNTRATYREVDKNYLVASMDYGSGVVKLSSKEKGLPDSCMLVDIEYSHGDFTRPIEVIVKISSTMSTHKAKLYFKGKDNCLLRFYEEVENLFIGEILTIYDRDDRYSKIIAVGKVFLTKKFAILDRLAQLRSPEQLKYRKTAGLYENTFFF